MAKDQTEVGITGKPVPKPRTAKQQYELEKKRRMQKHLGTNVGGTQYTSGARYYVPSTSGTNPRARTFREFVELVEAVYGGEKKEPEDTRMTVTAADKKQIQKHGRIIKQDILVTKQQRISIKKKLKLQINQRLQKKSVELE